MFPRLIFVDGPTGAGKDYFISHFQDAFFLSNPHLKLKVIRATDIVLNHYTQSENRKYTEYLTPADKKVGIFHGHLALLAKLSKMLRDHECDVVIVNRSFLSYLIYNITPVIVKTRDDAERQRLLTEYQDVIATYKVLFQELLRGIPYLFVNLQVPTENQGTQADLLVQRLKAREDGMALDPEWVRFLIREYTTPDSNFMSLFNTVESVPSGDYGRIVSRYYP